MNIARAGAVVVGLSGAGAVLLGAFGAHALRDVLNARELEVWRTAVDFQLWHALALAACVLLARQWNSRAIVVATIAFTLGIIVFCGSLYALALGAPRALGMITPFGGVAFIVGWVALAWALWRNAAVQ